MGSESDMCTLELPDQDLLASTKEELVSRLRQEEAQKITALIQRGRLIQEVNKQLQGHLLEIRELKVVNQRLQEENQELRELCCFLDDDRAKVKRLSHQWQMFGQQAARVMREDLGGFQHKLQQLEHLQDNLVKENLQLKELCLVLEEECLSRSESSRDVGDGSSSAGSVGSPDQLQVVCLPDD